MGEITDAMPQARLLTRLLPRDGGQLAERVDVRGEDRDAVEAALAGWYAAEPARDGSWWRMNMIGTLNARVAGPDGTSDSISNRADRTILQHLRRSSDAVLVGAETVRSERHAPAHGALLVVVTGSGELSGHRLSREQAAEGALVLCPEDAADRVRATMPGARIEHPPLDDEGRVDIAALRGFLAGLGLRRVVVEGGERLIGQCLDAGLLDEACLAQAPVFGRSDAPSLPGSSREDRWRRELVLADELGYLYSRLIRER